MPLTRYLLMLGLTAVSLTVQAAETRTAIFGGGCFWCMEPPFDKLEGVTSTISGYAGGDVENPTYEQVSKGDTGHIEVVQVTFDPARISYEELLAVYWPETDPTDAGGQFCDRGESYRPVIFYQNEEQRRQAMSSKQELQQNKPFEGPIKTTIEPLNDSFYPAEDYHQNYYKKNPVRYKFYRFSCGRDDRLEELWG